MIKSGKVKIDYPGSEISVNHYLGRRKGGGFYVKQETKDWKEALQWMLKPLHLEDYKLPLSVECSGYFKDSRSAPDISNLSKIILDSIEELTGINDKFMKWRDGIRAMGYPEPHLVITFKEAK